MTGTSVECEYLSELALYEMSDLSEYLFHSSMLSPTITS